MEERYRDILEDLLEFTGGKRLMRQTDVARYLGIDVHTVRKKYGVERGGIMATDLARRLCRNDESA